jgi:signal transduction histidine kinase
MPGSLNPSAGPHSEASADAGLDEGAWERRARNRSPSARWIGWRLRGLVLATLLGCLAMFAIVRSLALQPVLPGALTLGGGSHLVLEGGGPVPLARLEGPGLQPTAVDALLLQRSARWMVGDEERARQTRQHDSLARALATPGARFVDREGRAREIGTVPRGLANLGWLFWLLASLGLLLYLVAMIVVLVRPDRRNALYALMAWSQVGNLLFLAALSTPAQGWPEGFMHAEANLRTFFDLVTVAALVHVTNLHPRRLPGAAARSLLAWATAGAVCLLLWQGALTHAWWWTQAVLIAGSGLAIGQLAWMHRQQPHPLALQFLRVCMIGLGTLVLLTAVIAVIGSRMDEYGQAAIVASTVWVIFLATTLLLLPSLARTHQLMREFSLLAGVSTVATTLDLLFVAVFSLGNFASLTLALFASLAVYAGIRQWLLARVMSRQRLTTERMFEQLYRMAREVQVQPHSVGTQLATLLGELFEPIKLQPVTRGARRSCVISEGASLVVPIPDIGAGPPPGAIVLGFAERGRRLFNEDDARLADRVVDLIARAVVFDQAVERGRNEERVRIAQDLHDDIGARLLTLMYKAPTPEMEDYLRHTLKDLKTLTHGLAASGHRLSHAIAEWKSDCAQRVAAADCQLAWAFAYEQDFELSVVQWSALTRVLRELLSNALAHAHARRIEVQASVGGGTLVLAVIDDGRGREPETWLHGLGLGGVRKRVKQLGGDVAWRENGARGIVCQVTVPGFGPA